MTLAVSVTNPQPGAVVEPGVLILEATATDDAGPPRYALVDYRRPEETSGWHTDTPLVSGYRRIDGPGPYHWEIDTSTWTDGDWILHISVYGIAVTGIVNNKAVNATVTVKAAPPPPIAAFNVTPDNATFMKLTSVATGDTLTYAWKVDGVALLEVTPEVVVDKPVGMHTVELTVTDAEGRTSVVSQTVPWTWDVLRWTAQIDTANGKPGGGAALPVISELVEPKAAFRTAECINTSARDGVAERYSCRPQPDGSVILEVHQSPDPATIPWWDHPGDTGGDRAGFGWNRADTNAKGKSNVMGGSPQEVRHIRLGVMMRPETWLNPDGSLVNMRGVHNNSTELHGTAGGGSTVVLTYSSDALRHGVQFQPNPGPVPAGYKPLPTNRIGEMPVNPGTYHHYIISLLAGTLEQGGFIQVFRYLPDDPTADGYGYVCVSKGINSYRRTDDGLWYVQDVPPDPEGRIFGPITKFVKQSDGTYAPEYLNIALQHYRQRVQGNSSGLNPLPHSSIQFAPHPKIGPTYESVVR